MLLSPNLHRSVQPLARSLPHTRHHCRDGCTSLHQWLGCTFWRARNSHHRQRSAVLSPDSGHFLHNSWAANTSGRWPITPIANGMIEQFHRQLKSALRGHNHTSHWMEILPLALLGIRTSLKGDLQEGRAELLYGTTLRLHR